MCKEVALRYIVYSDSSRNSPLEGCEVTMSSDDEGKITHGTQVTDFLGGTTWIIEPTYNYYFWCEKPGCSFNNPDKQIVKIILKEREEVEKPPALIFWENYRKNLPEDNNFIQTKNPCLDIEMPMELFYRTNCAIGEEE